MEMNLNIRQRRVVCGSLEGKKKKKKDKKEKIFFV